MTIENVTFLNNNEIVCNDKAVAEISNEYFTNITISLGIEEPGKTLYLPMISMILLKSL